MLLHVHDFVPHDDFSILGHRHLRHFGGRELNEAEASRLPHIIALYQAGYRIKLPESHLGDLYAESGHT